MDPRLGKLQKTIKVGYSSQAWWSTLVIPALRRLRQEDRIFEVILGYDEPVKWRGERQQYFMGSWNTQMTATLSLVEPCHQIAA